MDTNDKETKVGSEPTRTQSSASSPMMMGMEMAKKMMAQMGQVGTPMATMQKMMGQMKPNESGKPPMEQMMGMCMGMCGEMLTTMRQTTAMATFATPELRAMFGEWIARLEAEGLETLKRGDATDAAGLAQTLNISEEGAAYLIAQMAKKGEISLRVEVAKGP